jgi:hypothetical protein
MIGTRTAAGVTGSLLAIAALTFAAAAVGQPAQRDPIAAEALFERGKQLMDQGHTSEACAAFAESDRLDPAGGTLLRLALCREAEGKLASAWLGYLEVVRISKEGTGEPAKLQERIRIAREHLAAIEPRVPKLAITVAPAARVEGLAVSANGLPRNEGTWGVALPVDPGDVVVVAVAPGRREYRTTVRLAEGQQQTVEVPPLPPVVAPAPPAPLPSAPAAQVRTSLLRPAGVAVGVLGLAAVGVGAYFGVRAIGKWNDANAACPSPACPDPTSVSLANDAKDAARIADVTIASGAVGIVAGIVMYVLGAPKSAEVRASTGGITVLF